MIARPALGDMNVLIAIETELKRIIGLTKLDVFPELAPGTRQTHLHIGRQRKDGERMNQLVSVTRKCGPKSMHITAQSAHAVEKQIRCF